MGYGWKREIIISSVTPPLRHTLSFWNPSASQSLWLVADQGFHEKERCVRGEREKPLRLDDSFDRIVRQPTVTCSSLSYTPTLGLYPSHTSAVTVTGWGVDRVLGVGIHRRLVSSWTHRNRLGNPWIWEFSIKSQILPMDFQINYL